MEKSDKIQHERMRFLYRVIAFVLLVFGLIVVTSIFQGSTENSLRPSVSNVEKTPPATTQLQQDGTQLTLKPVQKATEIVKEEDSNEETEFGTRKNRVEELDFGQVKIPHIIHRTFANWKALDGIRKEFHEECKALYKDKWEIKEWDDEGIDRFVMLEFPEYYDRFMEMEPIIRRVDAVRYLWMYVYGGVYLDMDVECIRDGTGFFDALPKGSTAYTGGFPEPFFLMSTPGNEFWLEAFEMILRDWKKYNVRSTAGPQGLNRMMKAYVRKYGKDAVRLFSISDEKEAKAIYPDGDVIVNDKTWRWIIGPQEFPESTVPVVHKLGFIPNGILDPTSCLASIRDCRYTHCHTRSEPFIQRALFVHHCMESWGGEKASLRPRN